MISAKFGSTTIKVGDTLRVSSNVVEGAKTRVQIFEGILIAINGRAENQMITVRHISSSGMGVERKWPLNSTAVVKIEAKKHATHIRRSKLYYLRKRIGRQATSV